MEDSGRCNKGTQDSEFSYNDIKYDYMIINITYIYTYYDIDTRVHPVCVQPFRTTDGHFVQLRMSGCLGGINFVSSSIVLKSLTSQFGWDPVGQSAETH